MEAGFDPGKLWEEVGGIRRKCIITTLGHQTQSNVQIRLMGMDFIHSLGETMASGCEILGAVVKMKSSHTHKKILGVNIGIEGTFVQNPIGMSLFYAV